MNNFPYQTIEQKLGYTFRNKELLYTAFVHSSYANEHNLPDNERMEFFGDAILENIASEYLYFKYKEKSAGQLSQARAYIVSAQGLKKAVRKMNIMQYLLISHGAEKAIKLSKKIEANLFEAVLCAIYLDGGYNDAKEFVLHWLKEYMDGVETKCVSDYKTILQEYAQSRRLQVKYVEAGRSGPENKPVFAYKVFLDGQEYPIGTGGNKKQAQIAAAKIVCQKLNII